MKKLITFSAYILGISIVLMAANIPQDWIETVDESFDGILFQTNTTTEKSDLTSIQAWLNEPNKEQPTSLSSMQATCIDTAGTVTRTLDNGNAAGIIEPLCWGDDYVIAHNGDGVFSGDGDLLTQAGLDLMIFTDFPTISGCLISDIAMNPGYTGNVVGTDPLGNIT